MLKAQFPNIPSFFKPETHPRNSTPNSAMIPTKADDRFTSEEINAGLSPNLPQWQPKCKYRQIDIDSLAPGPSFVSLRGRIVNLYQQQRSSQMPNGVEGCWRLIVKDDTGAILVILLM